ncbi:response regulator [Costertonia aggregata]|uniref:Response regulator n=1 Tax=Costertonia aggregata TaxID=343403 RepID=A0A7H9ALW7_9FLAO|nr:response regulator [Costertonia aggregata]QLG44407.1 response regulator [Costertonia aggregata]
MKPIIYIIDDNLVSQFATRIVMEQSQIPCTVSCFDDGEAAFNALNAAFTNNSDIPDILLLDLNMPKMDGWEFLEKFKALEYDTDKIEIFIISSFTNSQDRNKTQENPHVAGYFEKPLSKGNLDKILLSKTR